MKKVTILEIAQALNLSRNTVAKALNDSETVAAETRDEVIRKALSMGYSKIPSHVMERYRTADKRERQDIRTVLVLSRRESSSFWNKIIMGISDELNEHNCRMQFNFVGEEEERNKILPFTIDDDVAGIILLNVFSIEYARLLEEQGLPMVFLDSAPKPEPYMELGDVILYEGTGPVYTLTEKLIHICQGPVGFIGDINYCKTIKDRYLGYLAAMKEHGRPVMEEYQITGHVEGKYYVMEEVYEALDRLGSVPDGFVCANDDIARYVVLYLRKKGLSVPQDVAVTGFDNSSSNIYLDLSLSTVDIKKNYMGRRLAGQILWRMEHGGMPGETTYVPAKVIWGDSTGTS